MIGGPGAIMMRSLGDSSVTRQKIRPGTFRRILPYVKRYRWGLVLLLIITSLDAVIAAASPLLLRLIIDNGIMPRHLAVVVWLAAAVGGLALLDALVLYIQSWSSARIGQGLVYDLRTKVFAHVQEQPLAFFTRSQTGSLVSRLNTDVVGAQQAITTLLSQTISTVLSLILVLAVMFYLSWQLSLVALLMIPLFLLPSRVVGRRLQRFA